jgi:hypothetical protein
LFEVWYCNWLYMQFVHCVSMRFCVDSSFGG